MEVIQLLVAKTSKTLDIDERSSQFPDMTVQEMYIFLAIVIQMEHHVKDTLTTRQE
jgi:hypothetical protein